jgi:hypothetical protein
VRERLRATAAHNTVQLDGAELLEAWGSFRVGRRGRAHVRWRGRAGGFELLHAGHGAWGFLPGQPRHERLRALSADRLLVLDAVLGRGRHRVRDALHLHPEAPPGLRLAPIPRGAYASSAQVPLYERFNHTREMTEVALEECAELPWVGGFALHWDSARSDEDWMLEFDGERMLARGPGIALEWQPAASTEAAIVTRHAFEVTLDSAT